MRRVSYHFPRVCDSAFSAPVSFFHSITSVLSLNGRQENFRDERGAVKREFALFVACNRIDFEPANQQTLSGTSDEVDFLLSISDTVLRAEGSRIEPTEKYFVKLVDANGTTHISIAHAVDERRGHAANQHLSPRDVAEYVQRVL